MFLNILDFSIFHWLDACILLASYLTIPVFSTNSIQRRISSFHWNTCLAAEPHDASVHFPDGIGTITDGSFLGISSQELAPIS